jgi:hypothetical protein
VPLFCSLTSCTPTKSNLYLANSLIHTIQVPNIPCTKSHVSLPLLRSYQGICPDPRHLFMFLSYASLYGVWVLAPRPNSKMEDHHLSAVRECLFNIFADTLHVGSRSAVQNLRKRHAVVTGTDLSRIWFTLIIMMRNMSEVLNNKGLKE